MPDQASLILADEVLPDDERLTLHYVRLSQAILWDRNPKRHDYGLIAASVARYGFKDPPKFEPELNRGNGGTVEGNGRFETLRMMKEAGLAMDSVLAAGRQTPRGILLLADDDWAVPFLFGVDAPSQALAESYGIDHNNLTLAGGDFDADDYQKLWNPDGLLLLLRDSQRAEEMPESWGEVGALELLALAERQGQGDDGGDGLDPPDDKAPDLTQADMLLEQWAVQRGDIWAFPSLTCPGGEHWVMCGDSTCDDDVAALLARKQGVLIHADPPYGMGKEAAGILNDNLYHRKLDLFQMAWWRVWRPHVADNGSAYIWGNPADLWRLWYGYALGDDGGGLAASERLTFRNELVWAKLTQTGDQFDAIGITSDEMRMFPPCSERAFFFMIGEQGFNTNQENYWDGWEGLRSYLAGEVERLGWGPKDVNEITGVQMFGHWFTRSQWVFIRRPYYLALRDASGGQAFLRPYDANDVVDGDGDVALEQEHAGLAGQHQTLRAEWYSKRAFFDNTHDHMVDVWRFPRVLLDDRWEHPSPKPLALVERAVKSSAPAGGLVLAPFAGTGTDVVACERTGRLCRTMDVAPKWVAVTLQRLVDLGLEPYQVRKGVDDG